MKQTRARIVRVTMDRVETNVTGTTAKISDILLRLGLLFDELAEIRDILSAIVLDKVAERGSRIIISTMLNSRLLTNSPLLLSALVTKAVIMGFCEVVVITPFGVMLLVYKADSRKRPRARPCKPQQHDKRCDN